MTPDNDICILVVDDEPILRKSLQGWLREVGYQADSAASAQEALHRMADRPWDILLIDIRMPEMDGLELQRRIRELHPESTVIIMTAYASVETAVEAMKQGAYDYVVKPFEPEAVEHLIRNAVERKQLIAETAQLRRRLSELSNLHGIVGESATTRRVLEEIELVAASDTSVLIQGESGTGKELIARAIHASSPRNLGPIMIVSCGALSEGVLESELFGHEKGAFTGAHEQRKGKIELADRGTLFLDEIGDVNLKTQIDLLRVLEEKKICRVGGTSMTPVDFRLIAATNKDLEMMVRENLFRKDLFYRLNVFAIEAAPLRQKPEDIPLLAHHFLKKFSSSMNKPIAAISQEAMELLTRHSWPGNVRELENAMERAVLVCRTKEIQPRHLPSSLRQSDQAVFHKSLADVERRHVELILEEAKWNISQAARLLEIDRVTLYNKIKKYGLKRQTT